MPGLSHQLLLNWVYLRGLSSCDMLRLTKICPVLRFCEKLLGRQVLRTTGYTPNLMKNCVLQSLAWLLHNYFLPVLNPSSADQPHGQSMRPVLPLLKQYKALSKIVTRDASLKINYQTEITKVLRDLERWISETKVAANVSGGAFGWDVDSGEERDGYSRSNTKEQVAIEILCDGLLEKGCLVPLSKK